VSSLGTGHLFNQDSAYLKMSYMIEENAILVGLPCMISVKGKTGLKRGIIVIGYKSVLEWLNKHPENGNPEAPLWYNMSSNYQGEGVGYSYLSRFIKRSAKKTGIKKRVWNYLLRHTQLTRIATHLREANLNVFARWTQESSMLGSMYIFQARILKIVFLMLIPCRPP